MNLSLLQIKIVVTALQHLIQSEEKRMRALEEVQGGVVFGYNQLGRITVDEDERVELWAIADKEDAWLNAKIEEWTYQRFYLRRFLEYLQKELRQAKSGGYHAVAA